MTRLDAEIAVGSDYAIDEHTPMLLEYLAEHGAQPAKALAALIGVPVEAMTPWLEWAHEAGLIQPAGDPLGRHHEGTQGGHRPLRRERTGLLTTARCSRSLHDRAGTPRA